MDRVSSALATLGGLGRAPKAPGTLGSLVGLALAWWLAPAAIAYAAVLMIGSLIGVVVCGRLARAEGCTDPPSAILDECLGMLWSLAALPRHVGLWLLGFALFRLFDITKPGPIRRLERLPDGWGIMLDDIVAGLLTNLCLRVLWLLL